MAALEQPAEVEKEQPKLFTSVTPSGIEVGYSPAPRRHYKVRDTKCAGNCKCSTTPDIDRSDCDQLWTEVPSVTAVLGCLDKPLSWWGMTVGVAGVLELIEEGVLIGGTESLWHVMEDTGGNAGPLSAEMITALLTKHRKTVNHQLTKAGDRGTSVHSAFEDFAVNGTIPHPEVYPDSERPYVEGLKKFLLDFGPCWEIQAEVMVGSIQHQYAGRYDLRCRWGGGPMVVMTYPKRANKVEELPAGRYLLDLKSSSGVYKSHALQLAAYAGASDECGYEPVDYTAVIHVTKSGEYEMVVTTATLADFLSVRRVYDVLAGIKIGGR